MIVKEPNMALLPGKFTFLSKFAAERIKGVRALFLFLRQIV